VTIEYEAIGIIHSPFTEPSGMPIQPSGAAGIIGSIELYPPFRDGLLDLEGFSHIILLYHFHRVRETRLRVTPFLDTRERGVFATRAPVRPNPIGLSVVELTGIEDTRLSILHVDILDGTPLLDIKPYVPAFDHIAADKIGWLQEAASGAACRVSDSRFG
jgi:tRNA-Thr(GGU) m(6)t(6)A37 methyltransferase TsaA